MQPSVYWCLLLGLDQCLVPTHVTGVLTSDKTIVQCKNGSTICSWSSNQSVRGLLHEQCDSMQFLCVVQSLARERKSTEGTSRRAENTTPEKGREAAAPSILVNQSSVWVKVGNESAP